MSDFLIRQRASGVITLPNGKELLIVSCEPGTTIFDNETDKPLGIVMNRHPVINGRTAYLSTDDYNAAKAAIPARPKESKQ